MNLLSAKKILGYVKDLFLGSTSRKLFAHAVKLVILWPKDHRLISSVDSESKVYENFIKFSQV